MAVSVGEPLLLPVMSQMLSGEDPVTADFLDRESLERGHLSEDFHGWVFRKVHWKKTTKLRLLLTSLWDYGCFSFFPVASLGFLSKIYT